MKGQQKPSMPTLVSLLLLRFLYSFFFLKICDISKITTEYNCDLQYL